MLRLPLMLNRILKNMRNELITQIIGRPVRNKVLVEVTDIFNGIQRESGIYLPNHAHEEAWGRSPGFSLDEFFIRHGKVIAVPKIITHGTFDYETECELQEGDIAYWNISCFKDSQPVVMGDRKFLLVDYHEILIRVRDGVICPINGYALFTAIEEEERALVYTVKKKKPKWTLYQKPEKLPVEHNPKYFYTDVFNAGDVVYLKVGDKPFKLEGEINKTLPIELYACPIRMILCEA